MSDTTKATTATPTTPAEQQPEKAAEKPYSALRQALGIPPTKADAPKDEPKKDEKPKEDPKPGKDTPKAEAPKSDPKKPDDETPAEDAPKPEKTVKRVPKPQTTVRIEGADDLRKATETLKDAANDIRKAANPKKDPEPQLELPEDLDLDEIKALEEIDPKKFKGLEVRARKFWGKGGQEDQYISAWKKANPGQQFDSEAPEHADFYEQNEPFVTDAERKAAQRHIGATIAARKAEEAARKVTEPVQRELARERAVKVAEPQRSEWEQSLLKSSIEAADPEAKGIDVAKLADEHPLLHGVVTQIHESVKPAIEELFALKNGAPFDAKNQVHASIMGVAEHLQKQILALPDGDREVPILGKGGKVIGFKSFVPMHEFRDMTPDQREAHWTVTEDTILNAIQNDVRSAAAANFKAEADKIAKFGGTVKRKTAGKAQDKKVDEGAEKSDETEPEAKPVEAGASAPTPTPKSDDGAADKNSYPSLRKAFGIG